MFFDTHAHLHDEAFAEDLDALFDSFKDSKVAYVLNAACSIASSIKTTELCEKYAILFGSCGVHPDAAESFDAASVDTLASLSKHPKICAIGETGLDYYYDDVPRDKQKVAFEAQASLAYELKMPIIVHDRDAHADCLAVLKKFPGIQAVYHCFSGSVEYARELVKLGFFFSFGGAVTFKNARRAPEVLKNIPHEHVMLETDCPYMAPVPFRGKRNHPGLIPHTAAKIAELWGTSAEEVGRITTENALRFFRIK